MSNKIAVELTIGEIRQMAHDKRVEAARKAQQLSESARVDLRNHAEVWESWGEFRALFERAVELENIVVDHLNNGGEE